MQVYYDRDADLGVLKGKKVAVLGYGSQGHAHANNLRDSGIDVVVGLRSTSKSWAKAENAGLKVAETADAVASADIVMILLPDELQGEAYEKEIKPFLLPFDAFVSSSRDDGDIDRGSSVITVTKP